MSVFTQNVWTSDRFHRMYTQNPDFLTATFFLFFLLKSMTRPNRLFDVPIIRHCPKSSTLTQKIVQFVWQFVKTRLVHSSYSLQLAEVCFRFVSVLYLKFTSCRFYVNFKKKIPTGILFEMKAECFTYAYKMGKSNLRIILKSSHFGRQSALLKRS